VIIGLQPRDRNVKVKGIFFDAAGTLFSSVRPIGQSYALLAQDHGMEVSSKDIEERFQGCFSSTPPLAFPDSPPERIQELERAWWRELVRRIFQPFGPFARFEEYFSELFAYFSKPEAWTLHEGTLDTLALLRERPVILGVISNFDSRLFGILEGLSIASYFDSVFISSRVGYAKPSPEIFHAALQTHRLTAAETVYLGDTPETDMIGARRAGLHAVLLDPRQAQSEVSPRIQAVKEILTLVDG